MYLFRNLLNPRNTPPPTTVLEPNRRVQLIGYGEIFTGDNHHTNTLQYWWFKKSEPPRYLIYWGMYLNFVDFHPLQKNIFFSQTKRDISKTSDHIIDHTYIYVLLEDYRPIFTFECTTLEKLAKITQFYPQTNFT